LRVFSRYVVLPGGERINLVDDFGSNFARPASPRGRRARRHHGTPNPGKSAAHPTKKIMAQAGTGGQHRR